MEYFVPWVISVREVREVKENEYLREGILYVSIFLKSKCNHITWVYY